MKLTKEDDSSDEDGDDTDEGAVEDVGHVEEPGLADVGVDDLEVVAVPGLQVRTSGDPCCAQAEQQHN